MTPLTPEEVTQYAKEFGVSEETVRTFEAGAAYDLLRDAVEYRLRFGPDISGPVRVDPFDADITPGDGLEPDGLDGYVPDDIDFPALQVVGEARR